jgi:hypothetical protein
MLVVALAACGGRKGSEAKPEPVTECVQYEDTLKTCMHRDTGFARQPSLLPTTDADRVRIAAICAEDLRRLQIACR